MQTRILQQDVSHQLWEGMMKIEYYLKNSGLDPKLLELLKYRVSQLNGCGYCLDMHHKEAILLGETEQRLHGLAAWRESPYYSPKERSVLAYAENLTLTHQVHFDENLFKELQSFFSIKEIGDLTLSITQINSWNRISKAFGTVPGSYVPASSNG